MRRPEIDRFDLRQFSGGRRAIQRSRYSSRVAASVAQPVWTRLSVASNTSTNALAANAFASRLSRICRATLTVCVNVPALSNREYRNTAEYVPCPSTCHVPKLGLRRLGLPRAL